MPANPTSNSIEASHSDQAVVAPDTRPVSVLHLAAGNLYGGIETYLATSARVRHLVPDLRPEFAVCFPGRLAEEIRSSGAPLHDLGRVRLSRPWTVWRARCQLRSIIRRQHFDAIICHGSWVTAVFGREIRRHSSKLIYILHDNPINPTWVDHWAARSRPDLVLANSEFTTVAGRLLFSSSPLHVCYYPVAPQLDQSAFRVAIRQELGIRDGDVVILLAARLERWKGHELLLDALGRLKSLPGWQAWIAGGPQRQNEIAYFNELKTQAARLDLDDRVQFLGQRSDVARLMAAADIHCQPNSGPEPFGIVFIEAMYAGLPIVTTNIGGGAEIASDGAGLIVPVNDAASLAEGIKKLVISNELRKSLGANGRRRAQSLCDPTHQLRQLRAEVMSVAGQ